MRKRRVFSSNWPQTPHGEFANGARVVFSLRMTLEDHLGDIIAKGRGASGASSQAAAQAAGLSEAEFAALEETGKSSREISFLALGKLLGLDPAKLAL